MKTLLLALLLASPLYAHAAASGPEQDLFTALVAEGVYLHYEYTSPPPVAGAGSFYLDSISCNRDIPTDTYDCGLGDTARPFEQKTITGDNARKIFTAFVAGGIVPKTEPFSHGELVHVGASKLQCTKSGYREDAIDYSCQILKPLVDGKR